MIFKGDCCIYTLEQLLKSVKVSSDLDLIEPLIDFYQDKFKVDLILYKHKVKQMRENFPKRIFYLEVRK